MTFQREIVRWHPDTASKLGDTEIACEVIVAYDVLKNCSKRAAYNNLAAYSKGWLSVGRWRSIFWPDCYTQEQINSYRKRLFMMLSSIVVIGIGGLLLATGGFAGPPLAAGFIGGGFQSLVRTTNSKSIEEGCNYEGYLKTFFLEFAAELVTGGSAAGISAGISSIKRTANQAAISPLIKLTGSISSSAIANAAFSVATDAEKIFVHDYDITFKQVVSHAAIGAVASSVRGASVTAVGGFLPVVRHSSGERLIPNMNKEGAKTGEQVIKKTTGKIAKASVLSLANFIEERLDDEQGNRSKGNHLQEVDKCHSKVGFSLRPLTEIQQDISHPHDSVTSLGDSRFICSRNIQIMNER